MGIYETIIRNSIECKLCGDKIESDHVHDFKWCKCQSVAVDGGREYRRRLGNKDNYTDTSVTFPDGGSLKRKK